MENKLVKQIFIIILLAILLILPVKYFSNYIHESGHISKAGKDDITFIADFSINEYINNRGSAKAYPETKKDCEKFNSLPIDKKIEITHAGVYNQFLFLLPILIALSLLLFFYKKRSYLKNKCVFYLLSAFIILIFTVLLSSLIGDVWSSNPRADWNILNFSNCSIFS